MILWWTEPACFPRMNAVTVSTQQSQVAFIRGPIFEASTPSPNTVLRSNFLRRVYVVDLKCANIVKAALNALRPQLLNKRNLALPVPGALVNAVPVLVPVISAALVIAEPLLVFKAWLTALFAAPLTAPSRLKITSLAAIFPSAVLDAICVHLIRLVTNRAGEFNRFLSHGDSVSKYISDNKPKYFDVACKRIRDAYKQADLFVPPPSKPVQEGMDV